MDPDANVQERIELLEQGLNGWNAIQANRYVELSQAYSEWRSKGGFPADAELLTKLSELQTAQFTH